MLLLAAAPDLPIRVSAFRLGEMRLVSRITTVRTQKSRPRKGHEPHRRHRRRGAAAVLIAGDGRAGADKATWYNA